MAKFNKDRFINDMTDKVQSAINTHLISEEDFNAKNRDMLHNFIQYELFQAIADRKFAVDVLSDFNYDEKTSWDEIESEGIGLFRSLKDIALYNLWKFLEAEGATEYEYYKPATTTSDASMLDIARSVGKDEDGNQVSGGPVNEPEPVQPVGGETEDAPGDEPMDGQPDDLGDEDSFGDMPDEEDGDDYPERDL